MLRVLDAELVNINVLISDIKDNLLKADALRQSILKKAFSGQLVPQDPNDEPASQLLARIKAEKAEREADAKAKTSKKTRSARKAR